MSILLALLLFVSPINADTQNEMRVETATIYQQEEIETVFETPDGNLWAAYGDFQPGHDYVLVFDTNGTQDVLDDEVVFVLPLRN